MAGGVVEHPSAVGVERVDPVVVGADVDPPRRVDRRRAVHRVARPVAPPEGEVGVQAVDPVVGGAEIDVPRGVDRRGGGNVAAGEITRQAAPVGVEPVETVGIGAEVDPPVRAHGRRGVDHRADAEGVAPLQRAVERAGHVAEGRVLRVVPEHRPTARHRLCVAGRGAENGGGQQNGHKAFHRGTSFEGRDGGIVTAVSAACMQDIRRDIRIMPHVMCHSIVYKS